MTGRRRLAALALGVAALAPLFAAPAAHAGEWVQFSCVNPDGSSAPSQGWSGSMTAPGGVGATSTSCSSTTPMQAIVYAGSQVPTNEYAVLTYTAPQGSTVVGGSLSVHLSGEGTGSGGTGYASIDEPDNAYPTGNLIYCAQSDGGCAALQGNLSGGTVSGADFTGSYSLPANLGGAVSAFANCGGNSGYCNGGGEDGAYAFADVNSADIVLQNDTTPTATGFSGTALGRTVSGTANLILNAADPNGPGVYQITATVDGTIVDQATPNTNDGECVPVGSDGGMLEFDYAQPCPPSVAAEVPIPTAGLRNGVHQLQVSVTDAAGNTAPVFDQDITVDNPTTHAPAVHRRHEVHAQLLLTWDLRHHRTRLLRVVRARLPRHGRLRIECLGRRCPRLRLRAAPTSRVSRIWRELERTRFRARQRLVITVSAPRRRSEPIELIFRDGRKPRARVLRRTPRAR